MQRRWRLLGVLAATVIAVVGLSACEPVTLTAKFNVSSADQGTKVTVRGVLSTQKSGQAVVIERYNGTKWLQRASGKTGTKGAYSITFTATEAGQLRFHARVGPTASPSIYLKVRTVAYLTDYQESRIVGYDLMEGRGCGGCFPLAVSTLAVNGTNYPYSLSTVRMSHYTGQKAYIDINLKRATERFKATLGVTDESSSTITFTYRILADGVQVGYKSGVKLGQSFPIDLDVSGYLRLRIEVNRDATASYDGASFGIGSPKLVY